MHKLLCKNTIWMSKSIEIIAKRTSWPQRPLLSSRCRSDPITHAGDDVKTTRIQCSLRTPKSPYLKEYLFTKIKKNTHKTIKRKQENGLAQGVGGACISSHIHWERQCTVKIVMYFITLYECTVYVHQGRIDINCTCANINELYPDFYELRSISLYTFRLHIVYYFENLYTRSYV